MIAKDVQMMKRSADKRPMRNQGARTSSSWIAAAGRAPRGELNAVVDRRCGALSDHCLGGTLSVLAQCETRSRGVHRFLLLKTTTHTLLSAAQSTGLRGLSLCHCVVNIGALCDRRGFRGGRMW